jgi:hypothetical protein
MQFYNGHVKTTGVGMQERDPLTELIDQFLIDLHRGDIRSQKTFPMNWNFRGITDPRLGDAKHDKVAMKWYSEKIAAILDLPADFRGPVTCHIHRGVVTKTEIGIS